MKRHLPLILILTTTLLLTVGCTIPRVRDDSAMPTSASAPTEVAQATPAETVAPVGGDILTTTLTVEEVPEIVSYRLQHSLVGEAEGSDITTVFQFNGAFVNQPPTEQISFTLDMGMVMHIEMVLVDGTRYVNEDGIWNQSPDSGSVQGGMGLRMKEFMPNSLGIENQMELIGTETVNNRSALHYQGEKEQVAYVGPPGDIIGDIHRYGLLQLDIWMDETYNAIIRLSLRASNSEPPESITFTFDYTDLNSDIQIVAPETSP